MVIKQFEIGDKKLRIHEMENVSDPKTGRALTGSWLWESSLYLSEWLTTQTHLTLVGKTVVELGAGTGLPGLTAAMIGSKRVILTDVEPLLPGLRKNVESNGLGDRVEVRELVWGLEGNDCVEGLIKREIHLVLMSDVFYYQTVMPMLAETLRRLSNKKELVVLGATEVRSGTMDCLGALMEEGFEVIEVHNCCRSTDSDKTGESVFAIYLIVPPKVTKTE
ncbi:hypothetical protein QJS04_geneDACA017383 [Acorus gramineus]|uniref:Uncharacterized protein n=1 Tax=Acorus gramineus TaxID=55184 RepID=A0AAV9A1V8_ACOGR|nr:hypothetical protein QJS04_geneDACA022007 [Acorus gramineus]KAK1257904.1 hypothetical protein QJS04_geneDACA017383 [Acorus gramineus]